MRRKDAREILIKNPSRGLQTYFPPDMPQARMGQFITVAQNVRAEQGALSNAPGYERIHTLPGNLDSPANLIWQAKLAGRKDENRNAAIVGTEEKLYVVGRRARPSVCGTDEEGACVTRCAFFGDSGRVSSDAENVAQMIRDSDPDFIVHLGDLVYASSEYDVTLDPMEELFARYYWWAIGGYKGPFGEGPQDNLLFACMGNHDWEDNFGSEERVQEFFKFPLDEMNYTFKRGCVQVWCISAYGPQTNSGAVGGEVDLSSTGPVATWLQAGLAASDAQWKIVCMGYPPYNSQRQSSYHILRWPFGDWGAHAVISGDQHSYERIEVDGFPYLISGLGGKSIVTPGSFLPQSQFFYNGDYGALFATANFSELRFEFKNQAGTVIDTLTLTAEEEGAVCYVGDLASQPDTLRVVPASATFEAGQYWQFRAILSYANGNVEDVTDLATWTSADESVATVAAGKVVGVLPGEDVEISASYSGLVATAEVDVVVVCVDKPTEMVLVLEASDSMNSNSGFGMTRLDRFKQAAVELVDSLDPETDKIAVVVCSGDYDTQTPAVTVVSPLSNDFAAVKLAISGITAVGDSGLAAGLEEAYTQLTGSDALEGAKKQLVVLVADNPADVSVGGDITTLATARADAMDAAEVQVDLIKALPDACMAVVVLDIDPAFAEQFQSWTDNSLFFSINTAEDFSTVFGNLNNLFCMEGCFGYYINNPNCEAGNPRLNYDDFINWDVIAGRVDLCGIGNTGIPLYDIWPGHGLYVDLSGSPGEGTLRTKNEFDFTDGQSFRLTFKLAGNGRQEGVSASTRIRVIDTGGGADLLDVTLTPTWDTDFTEYSYEVTVTRDVSVKIQFQDLTTPPGKWSDTGNFLDDVLFENVTTDTVLLDDSFDEETC